MGGGGCKVQRPEQLSLHDEQSRARGGACQYQPAGVSVMTSLSAHVQIRMLGLYMFQCVLMHITNYHINSFDWVFSKNVFTCSDTGSLRENPEY